MTSTSHSQARGGERAVAVPRAARPLLPDLILAEWVKLRSVRSTYWTLLVTAVAMVGLGALFAARYSDQSVNSTSMTTFDATAYGLSGFFLAQLAIGVLGVLVVTSEYATGSIRTTFLAAPQRRTVLAAKAVVVGAVATVVGVGCSFLAFYVDQRVFASKHITVSLADPGTLRSVIGAGLYLAALALLAVGFGALIRSSAGAIAIVVALVFVLPGLSAALPTSWQNAAVPYLPSIAGQAIIGHTKFTPSVPHLLTPWDGFGVLCAYAATALAAAVLTLHKRDTR